MGTKTGRNGQHYAFIRFTRVDDTEELERRMNEVTIRGKALVVNIAKHDRKAPQLTPTLNTGWKKTTKQNQNNQGRASMRDYRTFADVMKTSNAQVKTIPTPTYPPTSSSPEQHTQYQLLRKMKPGTGKEAKMSIKYIGGLNVLIEFRASIHAKEFLADGGRWKDHIRWLQWGKHRNIGMWKTIAPFDKINHRVDLSCIKIGVLTDRRTRINDEALVSINGEVLKIGIIKFDEDSYPFRFDETKNFYVDEYGNEICMEPEKPVEATSPTPTPMDIQNTEDTEQEEGEIPSENDAHPIPKRIEMEQEKTQHKEVTSEETTCSPAMAPTIEVMPESMEMAKVGDDEGRRPTVISEFSPSRRDAIGKGCVAAS
ncbi:hypothetical protein LXL04_028913 [Taraxacum kok-saghyz]